MSGGAVLQSSLRTLKAMGGERGREGGGGEGERGGKERGEGERGGREGRESGERVGKRKTYLLLYWHN